MTAAQLAADQAVKAKITPMEVRAEFKLKRFQNVDPRTSTKRGANPYMVFGGGKSASLGRPNSNEGERTHK